MNNPLAIITQILDLLVPLEGHDRERVLRAVQAVLDLTAAPSIDFAPAPEWGQAHREIAKAAEEAVNLVYLGKKNVGVPDHGQKEKPARRAPKASETESLKSKILDAIKAGTSRPGEIAKKVGVDPQSYPFRRALSTMLADGMVSATGNCNGRSYRLGTTP